MTKMKIKARLVNKERPILLIKKDPKLEVGKNYKINFIENKNKDSLRSTLRRFNQEYFSFSFVQKVMGAYDLKYQEEYLIEIKN